MQPDTDAALAMEASQKSLKRYVPALLLERLNRNSEKISEPIHETFEAAVLFADISGFTKLTEALTQNNPNGVDELAGILDIYMGKLIEIITNHGGDIVKFAGDALFAVWKVSEDKTLEVETHRAVRIAMIIQERLHNFKVRSGVSLSLRIAIGCGPVHSLIIGGAFDRWEFLVSGQPLQQVAQGSNVAEPGQIVISSNVVKAIQNIEGGVVSKKGYFKMKKLQRTETSCQLHSPELSDSMIPNLKRLIPRAITARIEEGLPAGSPDLRKVSVVFAKIQNFKYDLDTPLEKVQSLMKVMQDSFYEYYGSINRFGIDDKGAVLLAAFGFPPFDDEDTPIRAVRAGIKIYRTLSAIDLAPVIGITTDKVFCGSVGSDIRSEYTMHGKSVNLSARLMVNAETILCDKETYLFCKNEIDFTVLDPIMVKGGSKPVPVFKPNL